MSEDSEGRADPEPPKDSQAGAEGAGEPRRALPARTGRSTPRWLGDWVDRTLDVVEMMADATRDAVLRGRKKD